MYNSGSPHQDRFMQSPYGNGNGGYRPQFPPPYQTSPPMRYPPSGPFKTSTPLQRSPFGGPRPPRPHWTPRPHRSPMSPGNCSPGNGSRDGNSWHSRSNSRGSDRSRHFDIQDYVSPSFLDDPWLELQTSKDTKEGGNEPSNC